MDPDPIDPHSDVFCLHDLSTIFPGGMTPERIKAALDEISPTGTWLETEALEPKDLPGPVRATFDAICGYALSDEIPELGDLPEEDVDATPEDEADLEGREEVTCARVLGGAQGIYQLGLHDPDAPFNPSGRDYYVRADGSFVGWLES